MHKEELFYQNKQGKSSKKTERRDERNNQDEQNSEIFEDGYSENNNQPMNSQQNFHLRSGEWEGTSGCGLQCEDPQCNFCGRNLKKFVQMRIHAQYFEAFNFYFSKDIDEILANLNISHVILFKDYLFLDDDYEYLKRSYQRYEVPPRLNLLTDYYENQCKSSRPNLCTINQSKIIQKRNYLQSELFLQRQERLFQKQQHQLQQQQQRQQHQPNSENNNNNQNVEDEDLNDQLNNQADQGQINDILLNDLDIHTSPSQVQQNQSSHQNQHVSNNNQAESEISRYQFEGEQKSNGFKKEQNYSFLEELKRQEKNELSYETKTHDIYCPVFSSAASSENDLSNKFGFNSLKNGKTANSINQQLQKQLEEDLSSDGVYLQNQFVRSRGDFIKQPEHLVYLLPQLNELHDIECMLPQHLKSYVEDVGIQQNSVEQRKRELELAELQQMLSLEKIRHSQQYKNQFPSKQQNPNHSQQLQSQLQEEQFQKYFEDQSSQGRLKLSLKLASTIQAETKLQNAPLSARTHLESQNEEFKYNSRLVSHAVHTQIPFSHVHKDYQFNLLLPSSVEQNKYINSTTTPIDQESLSKGSHSNANSGQKSNRDRLQFTGDKMFFQGDPPAPSLNSFLKSSTLPPPAPPQFPQSNLSMSPRQNQQQHQLFNKSSNKLQVQSSQQMQSGYQNQQAQQKQQKGTSLLQRLPPNVQKQLALNLPAAESFSQNVKLSPIQQSPDRVWTDRDVNPRPALHQHKGKGQDTNQSIQRKNEIKSLKAGKCFQKGNNNNELNANHQDLMMIGSLSERGRLNQIDEECVHQHVSSRRESQHSKGGGVTSEQHKELSQRIIQSAQNNQQPTKSNNIQEVYKKYQQMVEDHQTNKSSLDLHLQKQLQQQVSQNSNSNHHLNYLNNFSINHHNVNNNEWEQNSGQATGNTKQSFKNKSNTNHVSDKPAQSSSEDQLLQKIHKSKLSSKQSIIDKNVKPNTSIKKNPTNISNQQLFKPNTNSSTNGLSQSHTSTLHLNINTNVFNSNNLTNLKQDNSNTHININNNNTNKGSDKKNMNLQTAINSSITNQNNSQNNPQYNQLSYRNNQAKQNQQPLQQTLQQTQQQQHQQQQQQLYQSYDLQHQHYNSISNNIMNKLHGDSKSGGISNRSGKQAALHKELVQTIKPTDFSSFHNLQKNSMIKNLSGEDLLFNDSAQKINNSKGVKQQQLLPQSQGIQHQQQYIQLSQNQAQQQQLLNQMSFQQQQLQMMQFQQQQSQPQNQQQFQLNLLQQQQFQNQQAHLQQQYHQIDYNVGNNKSPISSINKLISKNSNPISKVAGGKATPNQVTQGQQNAKAFFKSINASSNTSQLKSATNKNTLHAQGSNHVPNQNVIAQNNNNSWKSCSESHQNSVDKNQPGSNQNSGTKVSNHNNSNTQVSTSQKQLIIPQNSARQLQNQTQMLSQQQQQQLLQKGNFDPNNYNLNHQANLPLTSSTDQLVRGVNQFQNSLQNNIQNNLQNNLQNNNIHGTLQNVQTQQLQGSQTNNLFNINIQSMNLNSIAGVQNFNQLGVGNSFNLPNQNQLNIQASNQGIQHANQLAIQSPTQVHITSQNQFNSPNPVTIQNSPNQGIQIHNSPNQGIYNDSSSCQSGVPLKCTLNSTPFSASSTSHKKKQKSESIAKHKFLSQIQEQQHQLAMQPQQQWHAANGFFTNSTAEGVVGSGESLSNCQQNLGQQSTISQLSRVGKQDLKLNISKIISQQQMISSQQPLDASQQQLLMQQQSEEIQDNSYGFWTSRSSKQNNNQSNTQQHQQQQQTQLQQHISNQPTQPQSNNNSNQKQPTTALLTDRRQKLIQNKPKKGNTAQNNQGNNSSNNNIHEQFLSERGKQHSSAQNNHSINNNINNSSKQSPSMKKAQNFPAAGSSSNQMGLNNNFLQQKAGHNQNHLASQANSNTSNPYSTIQSARNAPTSARDNKPQKYTSNAVPNNATDKNQQKKYVSNNSNNNEDIFGQKKLPSPSSATVQTNLTEFSFKPKGNHK